MSYVDGYLLAVPLARKEEYKAHAEAAWPIYKDYGAIAFYECWGDDVPDGQITSFPMAVKKKPDEVVVFSWVEWPDKAARDRFVAGVETDERFAAMPPMPFDGKRMIYGGFEPLVVRRG